MSNNLRYQNPPEVPVVIFIFEESVCAAEASIVTGTTVGFGFAEYIVAKVVSGIPYLVGTLTSRR